MTNEEAQDILDRYIRSLVKGEQRNQIISSPEGMATLRECWFDGRKMATTFLPKSFHLDFTSQQNQAWELANDDTVPFYAMCCYRGFGKSSMAMVQFIKAIVFRKWKNFLWIGETQDKAVEWGKNIKGVFEGSKLIHATFGNLTKFRQKETYADDCFSLCDPDTGEIIATITFRGSLQSPRGGNKYIDEELSRYQIIHIDDVESDDHVDNEQIRRKIRNRINASVRYCVDTSYHPDPKTKLWRRDPNNPLWLPPWRQDYSDTWKHEDAYIAHIKESAGKPRSRWKFVMFPAFDYKAGKNGKLEYFSCVPERFTDEQAQSMAEEAEEEGNADQFAMEMCCRASAATNACWHKDSFKYRDCNDPELNLQYDPDVWRFIIADPAKSSKPTSCPTGILSVAVNPITHRYFLRKFINKRLSYEAKHQAMIDLALEHNAPIIGVETTGSEEGITQPLESLAKSMNVPIRWIWLSAHSTPPGSDFGSGREAVKRARMSQMLPAYGRGEVVHDFSFKDSPQEEALLSYPKCGAWEFGDCLGYIVQMCAELKIYFLSDMKEEEEAAWDPWHLNPDADMRSNMRRGSWRTVGAL